MFRKSLIVFVVCTFLGLAISLAAATGDTPSKAKPAATAVGGASKSKPAGTAVGGASKSKPAGTATGDASAKARLTAAAIVDRNVSARGGLQAWRAVHSMSLAGKMGAGGNRRATLPVASPDTKASQPVASSRPVDEVQLPFVMEMARPRKMRLELTFNGQKAVQVFDGTSGWKLRPYLNRNTVDPFTAEEMKAASWQPDLDGYLIDYAAKGSKVELAGMEKVENHDTYKLKVTPKTGPAVHVWIDAQTFLEAKIEGQPRRLDGVMHPVEIYYHDYQQVSGLQIPFVLETRVVPVTATAKGVRNVPVPPEKVTIEKVVVNPTLQEAHFTKPEIAGAPKTN